MLPKGISEFTFASATSLRVLSSCWGTPALLAKLSSSVGRCVLAKVSSKLGVALDCTTINICIGSALDTVPGLGLLVQLAANGTLDLVDKVRHLECDIYV